MSDRRRAIHTAAAGVIATLVAFTAPPAAAQHNPEAGFAADAAAMRASYVRAAKRAAALKNTFDSLVTERRRTQTVDSVRAGRVFVRVVGTPLPSAARTALARGAELANRKVESAGDNGVSAIVAGTALEIVATECPSCFPSRRTYALGIPDNGFLRHYFRQSLDADGTADAIIDLYGSVVGARLPKRLALWLGTPWVPIGPPTSDDWPDVAVELATSRSSHARGCLSNGTVECSAALELNDVPGGDALTQWYQPGDIRSLVVEWAPSDSAERAYRKRCVDGGSDSLCVAVARRINLPRPLSNRSKLTFFAFAAARGGPGAIARAIGTTGTPAEMLAAIAGIPADSLVGEWRDRVATAQVPRTRPGPAEGAAAVAWIVLFAAVASRRKP